MLLCILWWINMESMFSVQVRQSFELFNVHYHRHLSFRAHTIVANSPHRVRPHLDAVQYILEPLDINCYRELPRRDLLKTVLKSFHRPVKHSSLHIPLARLWGWRFCLTLTKSRAVVYNPQRQKNFFFRETH